MGYTTIASSDTQPIYRARILLGGKFFKIKKKISMSSEKAFERKGSCTYLFLYSKVSEKVSIGQHYRPEFDPLGSLKVFFAELWSLIILRPRTCQYAMPSYTTPKDQVKCSQQPVSSVMDGIIT